MFENLFHKGNGQNFVCTTGSSILDGYITYVTRSVYMTLNQYIPWAFSISEFTFASKPL